MTQEREPKDNEPEEGKQQGDADQDAGQKGEGEAKPEK